MSLDVEYGHILPESATEAAVLFRNVFADSESPEEGALIEGVVRVLTDGMNGQDVVGFGARVQSGLLGAVFFSRMTFDSRLKAFLMAPVAVHTEHQGKGIGQSLIQHGLNELTQSGVQFVATYGDPAFYSRVGFESISEQVIQPPFALSQPEGWLGRSLEGHDLKSYSGRFICVKAFNNASLW
jgi:putative acetyltransferase